MWTLESINKKELVFYHGTKSAPFDQFNPSAASKGEQFWNPLGNGMYATNNPTFAAQFGGNVYKVVIPPGSKYRRFSHNQWLWTGFGMVDRAAKKACKMVNHPWPKDEFHWRHQAITQLERTSPYEGLYEVSHLVLQDFGEDVYEKFCEILPKQSDWWFRNYDFVIFTDTNDPIGMWDEKKNRAISSFEIVIFNPALQKTGEPYNRRANW